MWVDESSVTWVIFQEVIKVNKLNKLSKFWLIYYKPPIEVMRMGLTLQKARLERRFDWAGG